MDGWTEGDGWSAYNGIELRWSPLTARRYTARRRFYCTAAIRFTLGSSAATGKDTILYGEAIHSRL